MKKEKRDDLPDGIMWLDPFSKGNPKIMRNGKWEEISDEEMQWPEDNN